MFALKKIVLLGAAGLAVFAISCSSDEPEKEQKDEYIEIRKAELSSSIDIDGDSQPDLTYANNIISATQASRVAPLSAFVNPQLAEQASLLTTMDKIPRNTLNTFLPDIDVNSIGETNPEAFAAGSIDLATDKVFVVRTTGNKYLVVAVDLTSSKIAYLNPF